MSNPGQNEDNENIDEYYDYLPADHPLLKKLQAAMEDQLKKEEESLRLLHKERSEELKKIRRTREDIGINLYSYQQQYAKLEEIFNEKYEKYMLLKTQREETEKRMTEILSNYKAKNDSIKDHHKIVNQASDELNQLNSMLKYVDNYNKQVNSEIKVTNTNVHVVEKKIQGVEREKKEQDFLIDYLEEQIKTLSEKKQLYDAQLKSQKDETREARENLNEAQSEIENIQERKRNLLKDWDKSLISMKTRDKALQVVRDNISEQEGENLKYTSQLNRYDELIHNELDLHKTLEYEIRKIQMKQKVVENQINEFNMKRKKLEEKRMFLITSINKTKDELHALDLKENSLNADIELIEKNKLKLLDEARKLGEKNMVIMSDKVTHEKQTENLVKLNNKLLKDIFELQVEIDSKMNEIARVEIDRLNVETQNEQLKKRLKLMDNDITKLEKEYTKHQSQIKKNIEDLEKKQLTVDRLNKKYGELTKNKGGEDEGLFEIKIKELQSELQQLSREILTTEQDWIVKKTSLVAKENVLNTVSEENTDKKHKKMILEHKKLRLNKNYEMHEKEIREIEVSLKNLRYDMNKYNGQLSKNINTKDKLSHQFFDVEISYKEKLKQMENESVKLELEIEVLREEKSDTLTQIMEIERQIHLWERKIHLEEKMQEIIKPDKGIKEIDEMKSTIHRQELLYTKLKQEQEKVIKSMEMAIQRREFIKVRYPVEKFGVTLSSQSSTKVPDKINGKTSGMSNSSQKEIGRLKDDVKHIVKEKNIIMTHLENAREEMDKINSNIDNIENQSNYLQNKWISYNTEYFTLKMRSNNLFLKTKINQESTQKAEDFKNNKLKPRGKEQLINEAEKYKKETAQMLDILKNFKDTHPEWSQVIDEAMSMK